jgi:GNAT superfamily N-acetyltransferase
MRYSLQQWWPVRTRPTAMLLSRGWWRWFGTRNALRPKRAQEGGAMTRTELRPLAPSDSLEALTALLHRAYARLGAMGLNYTAVDQSVETTRARFASGQGLVVEEGGALVGCVVVAGPFDEAKNPGTRRSPWYLRRDVAHLHQLAVDPAQQGQRLGDQLVMACEAWARERGFRAIALDTAEPAHHLRARYARMGYAEVDHAQWDGKRYSSLILVKSLEGAAPTTHDAEHRCALVRALWAHVQARDWAAMRAAFADDAVMTWPVTGECFGGADAIVRVNAEYPEGWRIEVKDIDALIDGFVHSIVEVPHGNERRFANSRFGFQGTRIAAVQEHWATGHAPPTWRGELDAIH